MRAVRVVGVVVAVVLTFVVAALVGARLWLATPHGSRTAIARIVESARSDEFSIAIGALGLSGILDLDVSGLEIGDADGVWLRVSAAQLRWRPLALLRGRIDVSALDIDRLQLLRLPASSDETDDEEPFDWSTVPAFDVGRLQVGVLQLDPAVLGSAVELTGTAQASYADLGRWRAQVRIDEQAPSGVRVALSADWRTDGDRMAIDARIGDRPGGLLASMLDAGGSLGVDARLAGAGPIDAWETTLTVAFPSQTEAADPAVQARLRASLASASALALDGSIVPSRLPNVSLPDELTGAELVFDGRLAVGDDGQWDVERVGVAFDAARLEASGTYAAASGAYHAEGSVVGLDAGNLAKLLAPSRIERVGFRASRADGGAAHTASLSIDRLAGEGFEIPKLVVNGEADAEMDPAFGAGSLRIAGELGIDRIVGEGPLADAFAAGATLTASGTLDAQAGRAHVPRIVLDSHAVTADGTLRLEDAFTNADLKLSVTLPSFARFGIDGLRGTAKIDASANANLDDGSASGRLDVHVQAPRFEVPAAEALLGDDVRIGADVRVDADRLVVDDVALSSKAVSLSAQATVDDSYRRVDARFDGGVDSLAPLAKILDESVRGRLVVSGAVNGPVDAPDANAVATLDGLAFGSRSVERLDVDVRVAGDGGGRKVVATGALRSDPLELGFGGETTIDPSGTIGSGRAELAGSGVSGDARWGVPTAAARSVVADLTVEDLSVFSKLAEAALQGRVETKAAVAGDGRTEVAIGGADLLAAGTAVDVLQVELTGDGDGWQFAATSTGVGPTSLDLDVEGVASMSDAGSTIRVERIDVSRADRSLLSVAEPVIVAMAGEGVDLRAAGLTLGEAGRLGLTATASGADWRADVEADDVAADLLAELAPVPVLDGSLSAKASAAMQGGRMTGDVSVVGRRLAPRRAASDDDGADETAWVDVDFAGAIAADALRADLLLRTLDGGELTVAARGSVDDAGPRIDRCGLRGRADVAALAGLAGVEFDEWRGVLESDLEFDFTPARPSVAGVVGLSDGHYSSAATGASFDDIDVLLRGVGDALVLERFAANDGKGGTAGAEGRVDLAAWPAIVATAALRTDSLRVVRLDIARVRTSSDLRVDVRIDGNDVDGLVAGRIGIDKAEIEIPRSVTQPIPQLRVVDAGAEDASAETAVEGGVELELDLAIESPGEIFVRGRGIDTEWKIDLDVGGTSVDPRLEGGIAAVRGEAELFTRRFDVRRGRVDFVGTDLDPVLDIEASADIDDVEVTVAVGGRASKPSIQFRSDPALPEDEVLARVLFGSSAAELDPVQTLQLARAAARLSGHIGGGEGLFGGLRRAVGVDRLGVGTGSGGESALRAGKYLGEGVYLNVEQGLTSGTSKVTLEVAVTDYITLQSDVGSDSQGEVGLNWRWNY